MLDTPMVRLFVPARNCTGCAARASAHSELERYVAYELCHLLVIEADEPESHHKHVERVVTNLAKLFLWQRQ